MGDDEDTEFRSDARYAWLQGRVEAAFCNVQGAKFEFEKAFERSWRRRRRPSSD